MTGIEISLDIYAISGRYKQAYEYFKKFKELSDSVINIGSREECN